MRVSKADSKIIIESILEKFSTVETVVLFGSRVDDSARGGDIDIFVVTDTKNWFTMKLEAISAIQRRLGDQRIDLVVGDRNRWESLEPIVLSAKKGVILWKKSIS